MRPVVARRHRQTAWSAIILIVALIGGMTVTSCRRRQQEGSAKRKAPAVCFLEGLEYSEGAMVKVQGEIRRCAPDATWEVVSQKNEKPAAAKE